MQSLLEPGRTAGFSTNDLDSGGTPEYYGSSDSSSRWIIIRISNSGNTIRYAGARNNSGYNTYSDAWTDRASLTYGYFHEAN